MKNMYDPGKRFVKTRSQAGAWFIKDKRDNTLVCIVMKGERPLEHTEAMLEVMLATLNNAVEIKQHN